MTFKRRKRTTGRIEPAVDYGPTIQRHADGRTRMSAGAAAVEIEDRIYHDPETGREISVRGARRRDTLRELYNAGRVPKYLYDACERFLEDCSIASGGSGPCMEFGVRVPAGPRSTFPERQVLAISRVSTVCNRLGINSGTITWWVVFGNGGVREYEDRWRMRHGTGMPLLLGGLEVIDGFYNGTR